MEGKLTVFFEDPFWVGVFEREDETGLRVSRVVFGCEPTDVELYEYIQHHYGSLDFGKPIRKQVQVIRNKNFKRMQREVRRTLHLKGIGTKAQQALKLQTELHKKEQQVQSREQHEEVKLLKFRLKQAKKKKKQQGH